jgi:hypothetical protein
MSLQRSVFFATPTYDCAVTCEHHGSIINACKILASGGVDSQVATIGGCCFVDRARNQLVESFLASDCTDLWFVDADIGFNPQCVPRFMESSHDIMVGIPPKRKPELEFHIGKATNAFNAGAFECKEAPTAFMRIKRHVFDLIDAGHPHLKTAYLPHIKDPTPYFQCGIVNGEFLGEDIFFCRLWAALGHSIWIDANVDFIHRGSHPFKGNCLTHLLDTRQVILKSEDLNHARSQ